MFLEIPLKAMTEALQHLSFWIINCISIITPVSWKGKKNISGTTTNYRRLPFPTILVVPGTVPARTTSQIIIIILENGRWSLHLLLEIGPSPLKGKFSSCNVINWIFAFHTELHFGAVEYFTNLDIPSLKRY